MLIIIFSLESKNLAETVVHFLFKNKIPLSNFCGLSYEFSKIFGCSTALKARITHLNGYSLNFGASKSAEVLSADYKMLSFSTASLLLFLLQENILAESLIIVMVK